MIRKIKDSLTIKICLLMALLLLAVSGITYASIAGFLPAFYSSQLEEGLDTVSQEMVETIEKHQTIEEADAALTLFQARSQVTVFILDGQGNMVWPSVVETRVETDDMQENESAVGESPVYSYGESTDVEEDIPQGAQEGDGTDTASVFIERGAGPGAEAVESVFLQEIMAGESQILEFVNAGEAAFENGDASAIKHYDMEVGGKPYVMLVMGGMQPLNQAMEILRRIFPYILAVAVCIAALFALAASAYLTAPVVRLSRISRKMAALEFGDVYRGKRTDEIGALGRNLNEMAANLSSALVNLQQANEKLKTDIELEREMEKKRIAFFSAVSHELKTPITILQGHLSGMLQGVGAYRNRDDYLKRCQMTAEKMEDMVKELLVVSRMESRAFTRQKTDLAELLRLELADLTELIEGKGIELAADIPDHLEAEVNPGMLEKVFRNLLINAVRYTPADEGNEIRIRLTGGGEKPVECSVENTGVHIPEEALPHLFDAFYRVEQSRNRQTGGSGLGLYIVRTALEQHGAGYGGENTTDGVRFFFSL